MDKKIPVCSEPHVHEDVVNRVKDEMLTQEEFNDLSVLFKMYADPTRLKILSLLFKEEMCVCDISTLLDMTQSAVSHQLSVLRQNRIIKYRRSGKNIYYSLDEEVLGELQNRLSVMFQSKPECICHSHSGCGCNN